MQEKQTKLVNRTIDRWNRKNRVRWRAVRRVYDISMSGDIIQFHELRRNYNLHRGETTNGGRRRACTYYVVHLNGKRRRRNAGGGKSMPA